MAVTLARYDFRDNNNDLWHFRQTQDAQGTLYQLFDVNQKLVASGLDMHMSFEQWTRALIGNMMRDNGSDEPLYTRVLGVEPDDLNAAIESGEVVQVWPYE